MSCQVEGCSRTAEKRGWCGGHYRRWQRDGDVRANEPLRSIGDIPSRLLDKSVLSETGCRLWTGSTMPNGYGTVHVHGQVKLAHRVAYEAFVGPIPDGMSIDHLCRVTHCINPDHLEPVTRRENIRRGVEARRAAR